MGDVVTDVLLDGGGVRSFEDPRIVTRHTHGTGCTLASAIATGLAQGLALGDAVARGRAYVRMAIDRTRPRQRARADEPRPPRGAIQGLDQGHIRSRRPG